MESENRDTDATEGSQKLLPNYAALQRYEPTDAELRHMALNIAAGFSGNMNADAAIRDAKKIMAFLKSEQATAPAPVKASDLPDDDERLLLKAFHNESLRDEKE